MSEYVILSSKDIVCSSLETVPRKCSKRLNELFTLLWKEVDALKKYDVSGQSVLDFEAGRTVCVSDKDFMYYQRLSHCRSIWFRLYELLHFCTCLGLLTHSRFYDITGFVEEELKRLE